MATPPRRVGRSPVRQRLAARSHARQEARRSSPERTAPANAGSRSVRTGRARHPGRLCTPRRSRARIGHTSHSSSATCRFAAGPRFPVASSIAGLGVPRRHHQPVRLHPYGAAASAARYRPGLRHGPLSKTAGTTSKRTLPARLNADIPHPDGPDHRQRPAGLPRPGRRGKCPGAAGRGKGEGSRSAAESGIAAVPHRGVRSLGRSPCRSRYTRSTCSARLQQTGLKGLIQYRLAGRRAR